MDSAIIAGGVRMAVCPNCGAEVGFLTYFLSDHATGKCIERRLDLAKKKRKLKKVEEE